MDSQNLPAVGGLSAEELELLALLMEEEGLDATTPQTILPRTQQTELPLSFAQQRLWFMDQWEPGNAAYNIAFALQLTGRLNIPALQQALNTIVDRHEALRTTFATVADQPVQVIAPAAPVPLPLTDLSSLPEPEREAEASARRRASSQTAFDLAQGPLFVAALLRLRSDEHIVLFAMHHIISDGWSSGVF
ncbi:MAG TPA: condensation domain-containing protein, partial [Herpetosiphonaceae bacterium]